MYLFMPLIEMIYTVQDLYHLSRLPLELSPTHPHFDAYSSPLG
jgi:hypothetical protein